MNKSKSEDRGWPKPRLAWLFRTFLLVACSHLGRDALEVRESRGVSTPLLKFFLSRLFIAASRP
jgi:hypothetical protein